MAIRGSLAAGVDQPDGGVERVAEDVVEAEIPVDELQCTPLLQGLEGCEQVLDLLRERRLPAPIEAERLLLPWLTVHGYELLPARRQLGAIEPAAAAQLGRCGGGEVSLNCRQALQDC